MLQKVIKKKSKERYANAQPSLKTNYKENSKFIPFLTNGSNTNDWRIAYFIAHLRDEVNRHKGIHIPYIPSQRVVRSLDTTPQTPTYDQLIQQAINAGKIPAPKPPNAYQLPRGKNVFEIDYVGNMRFLMTPASMREGSPLHTSWLNFFCDLKLYLVRDTARTISPEAIQFIKQLKDTTKENEPEYNFAVAVVQTFVETLTLPGGSVKDDPDKWSTDGLAGTFVDPDEIIFILFAPGKIYNQRKLTSKLPSFRFNIAAIANKYYITQKGGSQEADNLIQLFTTLKPLVPTTANFLGRTTPNRPTAITLTPPNPSLQQFLADYSIIAQIHVNLQGMINEYNNIMKQISDYINATSPADVFLVQFYIAATNEMNNIIFPFIELVFYYKDATTFLTMLEEADDLFSTDQDMIDDIRNYANLYALAQNLQLNAGSIGDSIINLLDYYNDNIASNTGVVNLISVIQAAAAQKVTDDAQIVKLTADLATANATLATATTTGASAGTITALQTQINTIQTAISTLAAGTTVGELDKKLDALQTYAAQVDGQMATRLSSIMANTTTTSDALEDAILDMINNFAANNLDTMKRLLERLDISYADPTPDGDLLMDSVATTDMFQALQAKCGSGVKYTPSSERQFTTKDMEKFFRKRLNHIFAEADASLALDKGKMRALLKPSGPASIIDTFKDSGIYIRGENKHIYERVNNELQITDMTTGKKINKKDYTKQATCNYMGFKDAGECASFIEECILGQNIGPCAKFLQKKDYWLTDIDNFRHNANFYAVYVSLKGYDMKTEENSDGIRMLEKFETWFARINPAVSDLIPSEVKELLKISIEQINKHPAILNPHYSGKSTSSAETEDDDDVELILSKLHKDTRAKLPKIKSKGSTSGVIYKTDIIVEQYQNQMKDLKKIMEEGLTSIHVDLEALKTGLEGPSINAKYFQHQRGGHPKLNLNTFKHYHSMNQLKQELLDKDQRISNFLLQEFNNYITELNSKGTQIATENINKIKEELMKVKRVEILHKTILYYVQKFFFFFHSEFKVYLDTIEKLDPKYTPIMHNIELTLDELFKLVDSAYEKFNTYCATGGKIESLAGVCDKLAELASPLITEEITNEFLPLNKDLRR